MKIFIDRFFKIVVTVISAAVTAVILGGVLYYFFFNNFEDKFTKIYLKDNLEERVKADFLKQRENCYFNFRIRETKEMVKLDFSKDIEYLTSGKSDNDGSMVFYVKTVDGKYYAIPVISSTYFPYFTNNHLFEYISSCVQNHSKE